jgi:hypothetical protein
MPVGQFGVLAAPGGRGERRVDRVLPGLRAERADQHELVARPDGYQEPAEHEEDVDAEEAAG